MKLEEFTLTITRIEEATDKEGYTYLKCKGYNRFYPKTGKHYAKFNFFTSIKLYPVNNEQYEETKKRLYEQTIDKPFLKIKVYDNDLSLLIINGNIKPIIEVYKYDFEKHKMFNKKQLLKKSSYD